MHGACIDHPLNKWFEFKIPKTTVDPNFIRNAIQETAFSQAKPNAKIVWLGKKPCIEHLTKSKKGNHWEIALLTFESKRESINIKVDKAQGIWLAEMLVKLSVHNLKAYSLVEVKEDYVATGLTDFELFWDNKPVNTLYKAGLLQL
jgi:ribosomal protein S19